MGDFDPLADTQNGEFAVFEHWKARIEKANQLVDAFRPLVQYAAEDDSPVSCLYLLKEKTQEETVNFITVLRLESENQYKQYTQNTVRRSFEKHCTDEELLIEPVRTQLLKSVAGFPYRGKHPYSVAGIHVAMAKITYVPGKRSKGIEHWTNVAASVNKSEKEGTYSYWFLADPDDENVLYSMERYKDESYLWDVHVPSAAIQDNIKNQKNIRSGLLLRGFESIESNL